MSTTVLPPNRPAASRRAFAVTGLLPLLLLLPKQLVAESPCFPTDCITAQLAESCHPLLNISVEGKRTEIDITSCVEFGKENVRWATVYDGTNWATTRDKKNHLLVDITKLDENNNLYLMVKTQKGGSFCYSTPLPLVDARGVIASVIVIFIIGIIIIIVIIRIIVIVSATIFGLHLSRRIPSCFHKLFNPCCRCEGRH